MKCRRLGRVQVTSGWIVDLNLFCRDKEIL